ncbi:FprA family A-type flavoprotein [Methanobrevibacter sp.]|uniref:FprA family A-type flavoprotein n=1 Tax=Methanobrevibacter sp. TaxID=66852 RepID=UPI0026E05450|nr:FprA family A-type flavoprotein [Methanobrevibacter sp.]MDO5824545.1 FprA family A-type flavoprotein [Methanobrevibacter sp.]
MKAKAFKIADGVYWVGVLHWNSRTFHGYGIPGSTYNAYLVFGEEKTVLIDNVYTGLFDQFDARVKDAFKQEGKEFKIDVFVQNHSEMDHSTYLRETIDKYNPDAEIYASQNCINFLEAQYHNFSDLEITPVGTGDEIDIGGRTLKFISAPMLHWPDSMFTFLAEDGILFSNDAFGQHVCHSKRLDTDYNVDEILRQAQKYYANLVTLGSPMLRMKLQELIDADLVSQIKMIAPCHGQIWTNPAPILEKYSEWGSGVCNDKITVIYDTMHHSTEKLAFQIAEGIMSEGVEVRMYYMQEDGPDDVITDILDSKAIALGVPTMMNKPFPRIGNMMYWLDCVNFKGTGSEKNALVFSSKGWGGGAVAKLEKELEAAGFNVTDTLDVLFVPDEDVLEEAFEKGAALARSIKE